MVCVRIVWWILWRGAVSGALLGAAFGTFFVPLIGTAFGFLYGAPIGIIMGAVDAVALGAVAHFFMDMNHPSRIVPWLRLIGITLNLVGVGLYAYLFFGSSWIMLVPPLLAAITISVLCPRFVNYVVRVQKGDPHPITKGIIVW